MTAMKFVLGGLVGAVVYYAFEDMTGEDMTAPEWVDTVRAAMEDCRDQGMDTRLRVSADSPMDLECIPRDEMGERSDP
ncbi:hypothetical protein [Candidatus Palauibacter sp.]|uniref:hypothetical protein n=1 Tax=Candidatus Palauibacter sp. TaxID=3101350 RepID=UPI003D0B976F